MNLLMVTPEYTPLIKTGGLGDMVAGLSRQLVRNGHQVEVLMPAYRPLRALLTDSAPMAVGQVAHRPWQLFRIAHDTLSLLLLDLPELFDRDGGPYGSYGGDAWPDNAERFAYFSQAVAQWLAQGCTAVDIVHAHDWQTALVPAWLRHVQSPIRTVFTVHNAAYQGLFPAHVREQLGMPAAWWHSEHLEFHGQCAYLKAGVVCADHVTTVSRRHRDELFSPEFGCGLEGVFRHIAPRFTGIANGLDTDDWNPATDAYIAQRYDVHTLALKSVNKRHLQYTLGLDPDPQAMVLGVVSRLAWQKGIDLIPGLLQLTADIPLQWAILGDGDPALAEAIMACAQGSRRVVFRHGFDEGLAHVIMAGADAFVMPSRYEPCGLTQLAALRYGTLPVVTATGGLADTVREQPEPNGFVAPTAALDPLAAAITRAHHCFLERGAWRVRQRRAMTGPIDWTAAADSYDTVYNDLLAGHTRSAEP